MKSFKQFAEEAPTMHTGTHLPGTGDDSSTVLVRKKRKTNVITRNYIEIMGKRKKKLKEETKKDDMKCNKPKAQAQGDKSHVVKACDNGKEKLIRFGQKGVKGSPPKKDESDSYTARRKAFKARHAKNIKKGKMSAAYWADKVKW
jgi:hypothetical protein